MFSVLKGYVPIKYVENPEMMNFFSLTFIDFNQKLVADGLDIPKCEQFDNNGSEMAGIYTENQARVMKMNALAELVHV